jgi:hypothetical protein
MKLNEWTVLTLVVLTFVLGLGAGFYCGVSTERQGHDRIKWPVPAYNVAPNPFR